MKRIYNQTSLFGPLYAYLVVLSPPDAVKADIARIKGRLNAIASIGDRNLHSIAHITLVDRLTDDAGFAGTVKELIGMQKPFTVEMKGCNVFDHGHSATVYLDIENPEPIARLMQQLHASSKSPHISLAKKVPHSTLDKLQPYLQELNYTAQWICTEVTVLRKLMSEKHLGFRESFKVLLEG